MSMSRLWSTPVNSGQCNNLHIPLVNSQSLGEMFSLSNLLLLRKDLPCWFLGGRCYLWPTGITYPHKPCRSLLMQPTDDMWGRTKHCLLSFFFLHFGELIQTLSSMHVRGAERGWERKSSPAPDPTHVPHSLPALCLSSRVRRNSESPMCVAWYLIKRPFHFFPSAALGPYTL